VLAAQCAVALQRTVMMEEVIEGEKLRQQLETARVVQMSTLPAAMPEVPGYDLHASFNPADLTGGDTYDLALVGERLLIVLGDATGHGIGPALSVTQMQAMLRMAFRLGADLETAYLQVNNQLAERLPADRFITAFIGLLEPKSHALRFHSGGQAPILLYRPASGTWADDRPTSFPLAAMPLERLRPAVTLELEPGDVLALMSDGIFEYRNAAGEPFGEARVRELIARHHRKSAAELGGILLDEVHAFAAGAPQEDDMTIVLVKRAGAAATRSFSRHIESLSEIFAFTAENMGPALTRTVDFVLEELFTNVVKYGRLSEAPLQIEIGRIAGGVEVSFIEPDAAPFDVTRAPEADTRLPLEKRKPGGLGIHLLRKMVDSLDYQYSARTRTSRITFRKTETRDADD